MKFLFSTFLAFSTTFLAAQNIPEHTLRTSKTTASLTVALADFQRQFRYFDANKNLIQTRTDLFQNGAWATVTNSFYELAPNGKPSQIFVRRWDAATATETETQRFVYEYDAAGNVVFDSSSSFQMSNGLWLPSSRKISFWSPLNKLLFYESVIFSNGAPNSGVRYVTEYDATDRPTRTIFELLAAGVWAFDRLNDFFYTDADDRVDLVETKKWSAGAWSQYPQNRTVYQYTDLEQVQTEEKLETISFVPVSRTTSLKNATGQTLSLKNETFDAATQVWKLSGRTENDYNADLSIHQSRQFRLDAATAAEFQNGQTDYDYGLFVDANEAERPAFSVKIFPNPTADFVQIDLEGDHRPVLFRLIDANGKTVKSGQLSGGQTFLSLQKVAAGVHFLRLEKDGAAEVFEIVKT